MKLNKKSQVVITDLMTAMFIFMVLLTAMMFMWNRYVITLNKQVEYDEAQLMAYQISDLFVKTKGKPTDWEKNSSNTLVIGLANSDRNISAAKVNAFLNMSYNDSKKIFKIPLYDFSFQIKDLEGDNLTRTYGEINETDFVISLRRNIFYENGKAIMEFKLWK